MYSRPSVWLSRLVLALAVLLSMHRGAIAEVWTASYQFSPGDPRDEAMRAIAHRMARFGLEIRLFPSGSLLRPADQWDALSRGSIDMVFVPADYLLDRFPLFAALSLPGAVRSQSHAERIGVSPIGRDLRHMLDQAGVMVLADSWMPGAFASKGRCVLEPADAKGLRARTIGRFMADFWQGAGAVPINAPTSDALPVLVGSNLIDIANTSVTTLLSLRMEKSFACLTSPGEEGALWYLWEPILISRKRFEALSEPARHELLDAGRQAQATLAAASSLHIRRLTGNFLAAGVEAQSLSAANLAAWHKLARRTAWKSFREQVPGGSDFLERLQAVE